MTTSTTTHYDTLGLPQDASPAQIKAAWRTARRRTHPDAGGSDALFAQASEAYEVLSDPRQRLLYDMSLREDKPVEPDPDVTEPEPVVEDWGAPQYTPPTHGPVPPPPGYGPVPPPPGPFPAPPRPTRPAAPPRPARAPLGVRIKAGMKTAIWRWHIVAAGLMFLAAVAWVGNGIFGRDFSNINVFTDGNSLPFLLAIPWAMIGFGNWKVSIPGRVWGYGATFLAEQAMAHHHMLTWWWITVAALTLLSGEAFAAASRARFRRQRVKTWDAMLNALRLHPASKLAWCKNGTRGVGQWLYGDFAFGNAPAVPVRVPNGLAPRRWVAISVDGAFSVVHFECTDKDRQAWNKAHGYK